MRGADRRYDLHDLILEIDRLRKESAVLKEELSKVRQALELIASPKRPDGTYNRSREACEQLAKAALKGSR